MATQTSILTYSGKLGDKIGVKRKKKHYVRSMPSTVNQTSATRRSALRFGRASNTGALIRHTFYDELNIHCDGAHVNRLTKLLIPSAGNDISQVKHFHFRHTKSVAGYFIGTPVLYSDGKLKIPPTHQPVEIKVIAARIDFTTKKVIGKYATITGPDTTLPINIPGNGTLIVILQIKHNSQFIAADIIGVQVSQPVQDFPLPRSVWEALPFSSTAPAFNQKE